MEYKMNLTIMNPESKEVKSFELDWEFSHNEKTYGNGFYARVGGKGFEPMGFDLRYDKTFNANNKEKFMGNWARSYWSGENGAWMVKELEIATV